MSECSDLDRSYDAPYPGKYPQLNSLSWVKHQPDAPKYKSIEPGRPNMDDSDNLSDQEYQDPCMRQESPNKDLETDLLSLEYAAYGNDNNQYPGTAGMREEGEWKPSDYGQSTTKGQEELVDLDLKWSYQGASREKFALAEEREKSKLELERNLALKVHYSPYENKLPSKGQLQESNMNWSRDVDLEELKNDMEDVPLKESNHMNKTLEVKKLSVKIEPEVSKEKEEREKLRRKLEENLQAEKHIMNAESVFIPQKSYEESKAAAAVVAVDDFEDVEDRFPTPPSSETRLRKADAQSQMFSRLSEITLDNRSMVPRSPLKRDSISRIEEIVSSERSNPIDVSNINSRRLSAEDFADEDTLYPIRQELLRLSRTIETQTNDNELSTATAELDSNDLKITIPEMKTIKDGYIYTYTLYKVVTKVPGKSSQEFQVYRRYNDFYWLFEKLTNRYQGHVIPTLPPKNILTVVSKESYEFSENRKKELIAFLKKCAKHPFLHSTSELNTFLTNNEGLQLLIKRDHNWNSTPKSAGFWNIVTNIINYTTKHGETQPAFRQITPLDNELQNYDVMFSTLAKRLQGLYQYMSQFLELRIQGAKASTPFVQKLEDIMNRNRPDEPSDRMLLSSRISKIEDDSIKFIKEKNENDLKEIISSIEAINLALKRRSDFLHQLGELQQAIEEKSLQAKKRLMNDERLDELKKEYEFLTEKFNESSKILLEEIEFFKVGIEEGLSSFVKSFAGNNEQYLKQGLSLWEHNQ